MYCIKRLGSKNWKKQKKKEKKYIKTYFKRDKVIK